MIVTVAIRLALFPVFRAQVRSSRAMQELAPAMNDIKKKHGNDRAKLQQEQMKLYKERGINPIGGCLPMLVFFPVLVTGASRGIGRAAVELLAAEGAALLLVGSLADFWNQELVRAVQRELYVHL